MAEWDKEGLDVAAHSPVCSLFGKNAFSTQIRSFYTQDVNINTRIIQAVVYLSFCLFLLQSNTENNILICRKQQELWELSFFLFCETQSGPDSERWTNIQHVCL